MRYFGLQHSPALLDITQASRYWLRPLPSSSGPTLGEGNCGPPQVMPLAISTANAVPGAYWPPERKLLSGPSTFLWRLSVTLQLPSLVHCHTQVVPYNWYCRWVFPRDSSLKTLNCFPKVSGFSAGAWSPRTPQRQEASALPPCLEATMMLYLQPEWTLSILSSTLLHPYLFMSNNFGAWEPRLIPTKILSE